MSEGIFARTILLCLLVNAILVYGSPHDYRSDQRVGRWHAASCPTCQDRSGALSSPWYANRIQDPSTSHRVLNAPLTRDNPRFSQDQYRASRSRGTAGSVTSGAPCKCENTLRSQYIDPYMAPAAPAPPPAPGMIEGPANYPAVPQRFPFDRPNFYDQVRRNPPTGRRYYNSEDDSGEMGFVYRADEAPDASDEAFSKEFYGPETSNPRGAHFQKNPVMGPYALPQRRDRSYLQNGHNAFDRNSEIYAPSQLNGPQPGPHFGHQAPWGPKWRGDHFRDASTEFDVPFRFEEADAETEAGPMPERKDFNDNDDTAAMINQGGGEEAPGESGGTRGPEENREENSGPDLIEDQNAGPAEAAAGNETTTPAR